jgi:hypothetical protein
MRATLFEVSLTRYRLTSMLSGFGPHQEQSRVRCRDAYTFVLRVSNLMRRRAAFMRACSRFDDYVPHPLRKARLSVSNTIRRDVSDRNVVRISREQVHSGERILADDPALAPTCNKPAFVRKRARKVNEFLPKRLAVDDCIQDDQAGARCQRADDVTPICSYVGWQPNSLVFRKGVHV